MGAAALVSMSLWTVAPVTALWAGSQVAGERMLSMASVGVVIGVLASLTCAMALALTWLNGVYDDLAGRRCYEARASWLHSIGAEEKRALRQRMGITALERVVIFNVYLAVIALGVWYVTSAGPPQPVMAPRL